MRSDISSTSPADRSDGTTAPFTVPLTLCSLPTGGGYKLGIKVAFNFLPLYMTWRLFELDTGGTGFWSAYNSGWWPQVPLPPQLQLAYIAYASGNEYWGQLTQVGLYFEGQQAFTSLVNVSQIQIAGGPKLADWQCNVCNDIPPLDGNFYGDFGADMNTDATTGLQSVLLQIANGFIVHLGSYPTTPGEQVSASLQIGLSSADISGAPNQLVLTSGEKGLTPTGVLYINHHPVTIVPLMPVAVLFDTGTPSMHIWTGSLLSQDLLFKAAGIVSRSATGQLPDGVQVTLFCDGVTVLDFTAGSQPGLNQVSYAPVKADPSSSDEAVGYVNTGLTPFFDRSIMFSPNTPTPFISVFQSSATR